MAPSARVDIDANGQLFPKSVARCVLLGATRGLAHRLPLVPPGHLATAKPSFGAQLATEANDDHPFVVSGFVLRTRPVTAVRHWCSMTRHDQSSVEWRPVEALGRLMHIAPYIDVLC